MRDITDVVDLRGTCGFNSNPIASLQYPYKPNDLADDLESFFTLSVMKPFNSTSTTGLGWT